MGKKEFRRAFFRRLQGSTAQIPCTWWNTNDHVFIDRVHCHHKKVQPQARYRRLHQDKRDTYNILNQHGRQPSRVVLRLGSLGGLWYVYIMKPGMLWNLDKYEYALQILEINSV
jgi:hypothetical protein